MTAKLIEPSVEFETTYLGFIEEFRSRGEELIPFPLRYPREDFPALILRLNAESQGLGFLEGFVPHSSYWLVDEQQGIVGVANLRHTLNAKLLKEGGHIGYGIRPSCRQKGLGTLILRETLGKAKSKGLSEVLLTVAKHNTASVRVITNNGGQYDSEEFLPERGCVVQRYWIRL